MAVDIGPKIGIDGEKEYRQQINNIITQAKTLSSEMKMVTSAFDKNTTAEEKAQKQTDVLTKQIKVQEERVELLKNMLEKSAEKYGTNSNETLRWQQAVNNATTELNTMKNKLDDTADGLDDVGEATEDAGDAARDAADGGFTVMKGVLADLASTVIKEAVDQMKKFAASMIDAAATVKAEASQFKQTFGDMGDQAEAAIERVANSTGILDTRLKTTGAEIYAFAMSNGATAEEALALMETALMASADSAAYYDKSLEDTTASLQSFLKGNYANDAALGVSATEATRNAKAYELFGKKFSELTEVQKQQTLLQMVVDSQALSGAMGQAAREADGWENVQGNLNEAWRQFQADVGAPFLEALIPIIQKLTEEIKKWVDTVDWDAFGQKIQDAYNKIEPAITWAIEHIPEITAGILAFGGAVTGLKLVSKIKKAVTAVKGIKTAVSGLKIGGMISSFGGLGASIGAIAGPVAIAVAAIGGIALVVKNWGTISETAKKLWNSASEAIKNTFTNMKEAISTTVENMKAAVSEKFEATKTAVSNTVNNIKTAVSNKFTELKTGLGTIVDNIKTAVSNKFGGMKDDISAHGTAAKNNFVQAFEDMKKGVNDKAEPLKTAAVNAAKEAAKGAKGQLNGGYSWGADMVQGMIDGINSKADALKQAAKNAAAGVRGLLHFSRPDEGPLRDYETWMPDMMEGLAKGIYDNKWMLEDALGSLSVDQLANQSPQNYNYGGITINLAVPNEATGRQVMDDIEEEIASRMIRRKAVFQ